MKKPPLTSRQAQIFKFIKKFIVRHGYPPTRSEIAEQFEFKSRMAAHDHLILIEKKGYISIAPRVSRGIKII